MKTLFVALSILDAILRLCGAASLEELPEAQLEHYYQLCEHPLKLNEASRSELLALDFLSPFEIASILDYRQRNGDILSASELGSVIGIDTQKALDLSHFLSFESSLRPSQRQGGSSYYLEGTMRNGLKNSTVSSLYKVRGEAGPWNLGLSATDKLQNYYLSYTKASFSLLAGSFNIHYGQGLLLWSGFSLNSLSTPNALIRNPAFALPSNSSSSSSALQGLSLSFDSGQFSFELSAFDRCLAARLLLSTLRSNLALTALHSSDYNALGMDAKASLGKFTLWAETALILRRESLSSAIIGGLRYNIAYRQSLSLGLRAYSPLYDSPYASALSLFGKTQDQWALTLAYQSQELDFCLDAGGRISSSDKALRAALSYVQTWEKGDWAIEGRLRNRLKIKPSASALVDLKAELKATRGELEVQLKGIIQRGEKWSGLAELDLKLAGVKCYLAYYEAPVWAERLYAYAPDVPGSFAIKQYYGRGYAIGLCSNLKDMALKLGYQRQLDGRPSSFELRMYLRFRMSGRVPRLKKEH